MSATWQPEPNATELDWLVHCDWLDEHGRPDKAEHIRSLLQDDTTASWNSEYRWSSSIGGGGIGVVGISVGGIGGVGVKSIFD